MFHLREDLVRGGWGGDVVAAAGSGAAMPLLFCLCCFYFRNQGMIDPNTTLNRFRRKKFYFIFFSLQHLSNTNSADNNSNSSYESDETQSTNSDSIRPCLPHSSHIVTRHLIIIMDVLVVEQVIDVKNHYLKRQEVYHLIVLYQFINIYSVHREIKLVLRLYQDKWRK
jgi:hypothetical protein